MRTLAPSEVLAKGLAFFNVDVASSKRKRSSLKKEFKKHYGACSIALANQWHDLKTTSIPEAKVQGKEASEKG